MEKMIKGHGKYYLRKGADELYTLHKRKRGVLLFVNSEWDQVIICDRRLRILHQIFKYGGTMAILA